MDDYTVEYLRHALFEEGEFELKASETYNDVGLDWNDVTLLQTKRQHWLNTGLVWSGEQPAEGMLWGGCLESIDEMLRHGVEIPTLEQFGDIVLMIETSEGVPEADYVFRVLRALGGRGILERVRGVLVGRAKAWEFNKQKSMEEKEEYRKKQQETVLQVVRVYNPNIPVVQNMNFGHTDPQIPMPYGNKVRIDTASKRIFAYF